jgi:hypothetical protein
MLFRTTMLAALTAAGFAAAPMVAQAAVALAVGVTGKPTEGLASGYSYNYDDVKEAERTALQSCSDYKPAPKAARRCKLFASMKKGCVAIAFDPKDDSPGMGWAVDEKREVAENDAIEACRKRAPASRRKYCKIDTLKCDGDASSKK